MTPKSQYAIFMDLFPWISPSNTVEFKKNKDGGIDILTKNGDKLYFKVDRNGWILKGGQIDG